MNDAEFQISRQHIHMLQISRNLKKTLFISYRLRKKYREWALDPEFMQHGKTYPLWLRELPPDLQVVFPADDSPPWIPSHYIAMLHAWHHLSVILHHRPQLHFLSNQFDASWKRYMMICYSSAKRMCRLQEAILRDYGLPGLMCAQRGHAFSIYCVLTCTMLYLVSDISAIILNGVLDKHQALH